MPVLKEENGEEEPIVLPAHTKVLVTGNNRTKSIHIGLQGVVKKAVGLGGWYWLVISLLDQIEIYSSILIKKISSLIDFILFYLKLIKKNHIFIYFFYLHFYFQVLTNGDEVKLQRNALSVIEAPTENEENDEFEDDDISSYTTKINSPFRKASSRKLVLIFF